MLPALLASKALSKGGFLDPVLRILMRAGILTVIAVGAYLLVRKAIQHVKFRNEMKKVGKDSKAGYANSFARSLFSAFFPVGEFWSDWTGGDGTDEELCFQVAADMYRTRISFFEVAKAYKSLYNRELLRDLQKELSPDEYRRWDDILQGGRINGIGFQQIIATRKPTMLYAENMRPAKRIAAGIVLGSMMDVRVHAQNGRLYYGFVRDNTKMYVPAKAVQAVRPKPRRKARKVKPLNLAA